MLSTPLNDIRSMLLEFGRHAFFRASRLCIFERFLCDSVMPFSSSTFPILPPRLPSGIVRSEPLLPERRCYRQHEPMLYQRLASARAQPSGARHAYLSSSGVLGAAIGGGMSTTSTGPEASLGLQLCRVVWWGCFGLLGRERLPSGGIRSFGRSVGSRGSREIGSVRGGYSLPMFSRPC